MKKIGCHDLLFLRHDKNATGESLLRRILAGDKVFYTYSDQFADASVLDKLVSGDRVYIGAHRLADGSYWLHWLVSEQKGILQPQAADERHPSVLVLQMVGFVVLSALALSGFFWFSSLWMAVILALLLCFGGWGCFSVFCQLTTNATRRTRQSLQGFERVMHGDVTLCQTSGTPPPDSFDDERMPDEPHLACIPSIATRVSARREIIGSGEYQREVVDYQFSCRAGRLTFRTAVNPMQENLNPLLLREHPFFLAANDPLTLLIARPSNAVIGIENRRDGSTYLNRPSGLAISLQRLGWLYKTLAVCYLSFMLLLACFTLNDWWHQGGMPDKWDWLDAAETLTSLGVLGMMLCCGLMLLLEVAGWLARRDSLDAAGFVLARQKLAQFKRRSGKSAYLQDVA
ncbi:MAG: hypothetical protein ACRDCA_12830 [Serratia sp. (in: enterobacteria)]|uniref:hypothetical protein n=1 Tax=Serratia sp. (in: enterobacteria) TaxID=616 RepID=UPI003F2DAF8B